MGVISHKVGHQNMVLRSELRVRWVWWTKQVTFVAKTKHSAIVIGCIIGLKSACKVKGSSLLLKGSNGASAVAKVSMLTTGSHPTKSRPLPKVSTSQQGWNDATILKSMLAVVTNYMCCCKGRMRCWQNTRTSALFPSSIVDPWPLFPLCCIVHHSTIPPQLTL